MATPHASLFFYNVVIGGDVFGDTDSITTTEGVLMIKWGFIDTLKKL